MPKTAGHPTESSLNFVWRLLDILHGSCTNQVIPFDRKYLDSSYNQYKYIYIYQPKFWFVELPQTCGETTGKPGSTYTPWMSHRATTHIEETNNKQL